jgi:hypothetical protein
MGSSSGEFATVVNEVGLVVIAAVDGDGGGRHAFSQSRGGAAETEDAREEFRSVARLFQAEAAEVTGAQASFAGKVVQPDLAGAAFEMRDRAFDGAGTVGRERGLDEACPAVRVGGVGEAVEQTLAAGAPKVFERQAGVGDGLGGAAAGAEADTEEMQAGGDLVVAIARHGADGIERGASGRHRQQDVGAAVGEDAVQRAGSVGGNGPEALDAIGEGRRGRDFAVVQHLGDGIEYIVGDAPP